MFQSSGGTHFRLVRHKNSVPGLALYYLFGLRRYAAGHTFPVEESLPFHLEAAYNGGYELDPLPVGEGVEKGIELTEKNWNAIAKRYQRKRDIYRRIDRRKKSSQK